MSDAVRERRSGAAWTDPPDPLMEQLQEDRREEVTRGQRDGRWHGAGEEAAEEKSAGARQKPPGRGGGGGGEAEAPAAPHQRLRGKGRVGSPLQTRGRALRAGGSLHPPGTLVLLSSPAPPEPQYPYIVVVLLLLEVLLLPDGTNLLRGLSTRLSSMLNATTVGGTVDLKQQYSVSAVTITNPLECCLWGIQVHIGDSLANGGRNNPTCGAFVDTARGITSTGCNGLLGRYVSIALSGCLNSLEPCKVELTMQSCHPPLSARNLALWRPALQSSVAWAAGYATDGQHGSCSSTWRQHEPWWAVDLGGQHAVTAVLVKSKQSLQGAQVLVGNVPAKHGRNNAICGVIANARSGTVCCQGCRAATSPSSSPSARPG
ncbi:uncharacterized protein [Anas acuta]|uniref:uncharacterized protein n=1 Tax=Anas acuta TaxID=28680 RepID=UPI0035C8DFC5